MKKVLKFGGTSVGSVSNMRRVLEIVSQDDHPKIVVLSALSGTTNTLVEINNKMETDRASALATLEDLTKHYHQFLVELFANEKRAQQSLAFCELVFAEIKDLILQQSEPIELRKKIILSKGEILSTNIFCEYASQLGHSFHLLNALDFMRTDRLGEPDEYYIESMLERVLGAYDKGRIFITQGYICLNAFGEIDNLNRGGSDYTATLIGTAWPADVIEIWTDIDGMHNNDPRVVDNTIPISKISYAEAAELAYFGAKILHPACVRPAEKKAIPIALKNTMDPNAVGTLISNESNEKVITAIAAKDGITAIKIVSGRMLMAYGFLKRVFEVFEHFETPIDMITTSEVAVSLTIDNHENLPKIVHELRRFGHVEVDDNQTIICIVGNFISEKMGVAQQLFAPLKEVPIRMISYGGSPHNVSILVHSDHKIEALKSLNHGLFDL